MAEEHLGRAFVSRIAAGSALKVTPIERVVCSDGTYIVDWRLVYPLLFNCYMWAHVVGSATVTPLDGTDLCTLDADWYGARQTAAQSADTLLKEYRRALWQRRSRMELLRGLLKAYQVMAATNRDRLATMRQRVQSDNLAKIESNVARWGTALTVMQSLRDLSVAGLSIGATFLTAGGAALAVGGAGVLSGGSNYIEKGDAANAVLTAAATILSGVAGRVPGLGTKLILSSLAPAISGVVTYREIVALSTDVQVQTNGGMIFINVAAASTLGAFGNMAGAATPRDATGKFLVFVLSAGLDTASGAMNSVAKGRSSEEIAKEAASSFISKGAGELMKTEPVAKLLKRGVFHAGMAKNLGMAPPPAQRGKNLHDVVVGITAQAVEKTTGSIVSWATASGDDRVAASSRLPLIGDQSLYDALVQRAIRRQP